MTALRQVTDAYYAQCFKVQHILGDRQFEHARKYIEKWELC